MIFSHSQRSGSLAHCFLFFSEGFQHYFLKEGFYDKIRESKNILQFHIKENSQFFRLLGKNLGQGGREDEYKQNSLKLIEYNFITR